MKKKILIFISGLLLMCGVAATIPLLNSCASQVENKEEKEEHKIYMKNYLVFDKTNTAVIDGHNCFKFWLFESDYPITPTKAKELLKKYFFVDNKLDKTLTMVENAYTYNFVFNNDEISQFDLVNWYCIDFNML